MPNGSPFRVADLTDDRDILSVLEGERDWAIYPLSDLDPPHRQFARYIGAARSGAIRAVLLAYTPPDFTSLIPSGDADAVRAIFQRAEGLPPTGLYHVRSDDMPGFEGRYLVQDRQWFLRMAVGPQDFREAPPVEARLARLSPADLPQLRDLYAVWGETVFTPLMLEWGVYVGAYRGGRLVAVAGTHVVSRSHRVASIGGVFTHPDHRGQGLATAATGAVAAVLLRDGISTVALNVRADNEPAVRAYCRIGMSVALGFWEGHAALRSAPAP